MNAEDKDAVMGLLLAAHNRANEAALSADELAWEAYQDDNPTVEWSAEDAESLATEAQVMILDTISFVEVL